MWSYWAQCADLYFPTTHLMNSACCCGPSGVFLYCILAQGEKGREKWSSVIFIFCRLLFVSRELKPSSLFSHLHSLQVCKKHINLSASVCSTKTLLQQDACYLHYDVVELFLIIFSVFPSIYCCVDPKSSRELLKPLPFFKAGLVI